MGENGDGETSHYKVHEKNSPPNNEIYDQIVAIQIQGTVQMRRRCEDDRRQRDRERKWIILDASWILEGKKEGLQ